MKIHADIEQGSCDWMILRAGKICASEMDALVSPEGEVRKGAMPATYLAQKTAEWWLQGPILSFTSIAAEQGSILESEAVPFAALEYGWNIERPGFITTDDEIVGCSPDGWIDGKTGLEIKCPTPAVHVKYLLNGYVPKEYRHQIQTSLWVTKAESWKFLSYRRGFPKLMLEVAPDPTFQSAISEAVEAFTEKFEAAKARLITLNGGQRPKRPVSVPAAAPVEDDGELVP